MAQGFRPFVVSKPSLVRPARLLVMLLSVLALGVASLSLGVAQTEASDPALDAEEAAAIALINDMRAAAGLLPVQPSATLMAHADWMAADMAARETLTHVDSLGRAFRERVSSFGYPSNTSIRENIASGYRTAARLVQAWTDSGAHEANLLTENARAVGIGRVTAGNTNETVYWVLNLGSVLDLAVETGAESLSAPSEQVATANYGVRTVLLQPGWNLVSWLGPLTDTASATSALGPAVDQIYGWDARTGSWQSFVTAPRIGTLRTLDEGRAIWVHVRGTASLTWTQPLTQVGQRAVRLDDGWTLLTWTGADGTALSDALGSVDDSLAVLASFDAASQQFDVYRPGLPPFSAAPTLDHGDAFWLLIEASGAQPAAAP